MLRFIYVGQQNACSASFSTIHFFLGKNVNPFQNFCEIFLRLFTVYSISTMLSSGSVCVFVCVWCAANPQKYCYKFASNFHVKNEKLYFIREFHSLSLALTLCIARHHRSKRTKYFCSIMLYMQLNNTHSVALHTFIYTIHKTYIH